MGKGKGEKETRTKQLPKIMSNNLLLTGHPGLGKTTLLKRILEHIGNVALTGFYTEEIREDGVRVGFRAVTLSGSSTVFAHRNFQTEAKHRLGKYGVRPDLLEGLVLSHLDPLRKAADLIVVDEISKMELLSQRFRESLLEALDSKCPLLGTISLRGTGLIKRIQQRPDVSLLRLTRKNRSSLGEEVLRRVREHLNQTH